MGDDLDIGVVKKTQETLGKVIKKPPLTEKLLRKPPFRFLHDIMTTVINNTGFMKGLYTAEEMNSDEVKDKEKKIAFLQKAIDVVAFSTGKSLSARPSKIVAGLEAEKTNEFLQALGKAIINKLDSAKAVESVLSGVHPSTKRNKPEADKISDLANGNAGKAKKENREKTDKKSSVKENVETSKTREKISSSERKKEKPTVKPSPEKPSRTKESPGHRDKSSPKTTDISKKSHAKDPSPVKTVTKRTDSKESPAKRPDKVSKEKGSPVKKQMSAEKGSPVKKQMSAEKESPLRIRRSSKDSPDKKIKDPPNRESSGSASKKSERSAERSRNTLDDKEITIKTERAEDEPVALVSNHVTNGDGEHEVEVEKCFGRPPTGRPLTAKLSKARTVNETQSEEVQPAGDVSETRTEPDERAQDTAPRPSTSLRRRSARPPSARPAAPRVKSVDSADEQPRVDSKNQVQNIILDNGVVPEDEDENFVVAESSAQPEAFLKVNATASSQDASPQVGQGSLVTQILETKKDLEADGKRSTKVEIDKSELSDTAKKRERERTAEEVERLRECVQSLVRGANPLGKRLDYLQEDLDTMQRELDAWTRESKRYIQELKMAESKSDTDAERLKAQLKEADDAIVDQQARIFAIKSNILRQEARIRKMVAAAKL